jgi:phenylpropionate dioxygenase-like ring-hydroxylating dioxygenase large terminal subunit
MLINNWYVAAAAQDVKANQPLSVRMLCCDFVLFRDANAQPVCLSDVCCHRGALLSGGDMTPHQYVACPYHGWEFDHTGRCVHIPALGKETNVPKRARIDSYPTQEKYGWVWVFLGDLPEKERPVIPDLFPEHGDTENWRQIPYGFEAKANWMRFEENSLDTAHTNFVHRQFGSKRSAKLKTFPIEQLEWGARVSRERPAPLQNQKSGEIAKLLSKERSSTRVTLEFSLVGLCHRIQPTFKEGMSQINFTARTPVDQYLSRAIGWQARNYLREPEFDKERMAGILLAVEEDLSVVERVRPKLTPPSLSDEFLTETDGMETAFRKCVWRWARQGWEIDMDKFEALSKDRVLVIPSPARRADPKNWVHKPVPLKPASEASE